MRTGLKLIFEYNLIIMMKYLLFVLKNLIFTVFIYL